MFLVLTPPANNKALLLCCVEVVYLKKKHKFEGEKAWNIIIIVL